MSTDRAILLKSYIDSLAVASVMNNLQPEKKYIFLPIKKQMNCGNHRERVVVEINFSCRYKKYTKYLKTKFEVEYGFECESIFETKINIREIIFQIIRHAVNILILKIREYFQQILG